MGRGGGLRNGFPGTSLKLSPQRVRGDSALPSACRGFFEGNFASRSRPTREDHHKSRAPRHEAPSVTSHEPSHRSQVTPGGSRPLGSTNFAPWRTKVPSALVLLPAESTFGHMGDPTPGPCPNPLAPEDSGAKGATPRVSRTCPRATAQAPSPRHAPTHPRSGHPVDLKEWVTGILTPVIVGSPGACLTPPIGASLVHHPWCSTQEP